jgi:hypothetical protein
VRVLLDTSALYIAAGLSDLTFPARVAMFSKIPDSHLVNTFFRSPARPDLNK